MGHSTASGRAATGSVNRSEASAQLPPAAQDLIRRIPSMDNNDLDRLMELWEGRMMASTGEERELSQRVLSEFYNENVRRRR